MKITSQTEKMFNVFEEIYNNYTKCQFKKVSMNSASSFSEVVVENAITIYKNQRNNEIL